jgi:hypothetical protein
MERVPEEPRQVAREPQTEDLDHGVPLTERDEHAARREVDDTEVAAGELGHDVLGGQPSVGERRGDDGDRRARVALDRDRIARAVDLRVAGYAQRPIDHDPPQAIPLDRQASERR